MHAPQCKVKLPSIMPPSKAELKRRREAFERITAIRDAMQPLGCSVVDLIRECR